MLPKLGPGKFYARMVGPTNRTIKMLDPHTAALCIDRGCSIQVVPLLSLLGIRLMPAIPWHVNRKIIPKDDACCFSCCRFVVMSGLPQKNYSGSPTLESLSNFLLLVLADTDTSCCVNVGTSEQPSFELQCSTPPSNSLSHLA